MVVHDVEQETLLEIPKLESFAVRSTEFPSRESFRATSNLALLTL